MARRVDGEGTITKRPDGRWQGRISARCRSSRSTSSPLGLRPHALRGRGQAACSALPRSGRTAADRRGGHGGRVSALVGRARPPGHRARHDRLRVPAHHRDAPVPRIGHHRLGKLAPAHVHDMLRDLEREGRGLGHAAQRARRVAPALAHVERWELVTRNVAALVDAPRGTTKTDDVLDLDGVRRLIDAAKGDRLEALYVIAVTVGLRKGEALVPTWNDVDLDAAEVTVRGTLRRIPGRGIVVNAPKSERGARTVALLLIVVDALRRRRQRGRLERMAMKDWTDLDTCSRRRSARLSTRTICNARGVRSPTGLDSACSGSMCSGTRR